MTTARAAELRLDCRLPSVTVARHFVRDRLREWDLERLVDDAQLGVSELVANAVKHAGTDLVLTLSVDGEARFTVADEHPSLHKPVGRSGRDVLAESGRGLQIIAAIAVDWGVSALPAGKAIWFSLPLPDVGTADATYYTLADHRNSGQSQSPRGMTAAGQGS